MSNYGRAYIGVCNLKQLAAETLSKIDDKTLRRYLVGYANRHRDQIINLEEVFLNPPKYSGFILAAAASHVLKERHGLDYVLSALAMRNERPSNFRSVLSAAFGSSRLLKLLRPSREFNP